jgi:hypothetical protein
MIIECKTLVFDEDDRAYENEIWVKISIDLNNIVVVREFIGDHNSVFDEYCIIYIGEDPFPVDIPYEEMKHRWKKFKESNYIKYKN